MTADVFIVHGHYEEMKHAAARALSKMALNPIILHEQPNEGRTLIEKFEKNSNVQFAVVLLSPDDLSYSATSDATKARFRARQNVVLGERLCSPRFGKWPSPLFVEFLHCGLLHDFSV